MYIFVNIIILSTVPLIFKCWKTILEFFFKYFPEICDFHKEITIFTKKRAILHVDIAKNISLIQKWLGNKPYLLLEMSRNLGFFIKCYFFWPQNGQICLKKKITFINSIKHILAEYDEKICFEDRVFNLLLWRFDKFKKKVMHQSFWI